MELGIHNWKTFRLNDIFEINSGNKFDKSKMLITEISDINFVGRTGTNNGVVASVNEINGIKPFSAGYITLALGGSIGSCFIQTKPFYTSQNVAVLIPKKDMSISSKQFIATLIKKESDNNYLAFARELNTHIKKDFQIKLPVTGTNEPDFKFMESYIASLNIDISAIPDYFLSEGYDKAIWYLDNIDDKKFEEEYASSYSDKKIKINPTEWKKFKIGEIFKTYTGGDLILSKVINGDIPVISHSSENNGVKLYSSEIQSRKLFDCNKTLSLADRGTFFAAVQNKDFYIGTRVKALEFKDGKHSKFVLLFFATVLNFEKFRFNYGRNCTNGLEDLEISLPALNGKPDYNFMENYIKGLSFSKHLCEKGK